MADFAPTHPGEILLKLPGWPSALCSARPRSSASRCSGPTMTNWRGCAAAVRSESL